MIYDDNDDDVDPRESGSLSAHKRKVETPRRSIEEYLLCTGEATTTTTTTTTREICKHETPAAAACLSLADSLSRFTSPIAVTSKMGYLRLLPLIQREEGCSAGQLWHTSSSACIKTTAAIFDIS